MQSEIQISKAGCCSGIGDLFRCSKKADYILIAAGILLATLNGIGIPLFSLLWGNLVDSLTNSSEALGKAKSVMLDFVYLGIGVFFAGWGSFTCWMITGSRQSMECRKLYLKKLLKQEIAWFDTKNQEEISLKFSADCLTYEKAIGQNFYSLVMTAAMMIAGTTIAFIRGWLLSLVIFAAIPFLVYGYYVYGKASANKNKVQEQAFAEVGGKMEEIFSSIQTVKMLNGQDYELGKFSQILDKARKKMFTFIKWMSFYVALSYMFLLLTFALGYWFGTKCVAGSEGCLTSYSAGTVYSAGNALLVVFSLIIPAVNLNQLIVSFEKAAQGKAAAARIFEVIDRAPLIQSSPNAIVPTGFKGVFRFENVSFTYPTSSEKVLDGLNLKIAAKSTAIVGQSGCGKSTIFQLMMRFYDPSEGRVTLDGVDLKEIDLQWLRKQIGYVGQEPVLFAMSVKENLLLGNPRATDEEIIAALKEAQAYDFVCQLKDKHDSFVGNAGNLISGGQKQRIAIARALIKKPQLLLLDQATSSLDLVNQALIQDTLIKISQKIKTITIAHRKATIRSNEELYYIQHGKILMKGNYLDFKELIEKKNNELPVFQNFLNFSSRSLRDTNLCVTNKNMAQSEAHSHTQLRLSAMNQQVAEQNPDQAIWEKLYEYLKGNRLLLLFVMLVTIINGICFPLFAVFLSKILVIWIQYNYSDPGSSISSANLYSIYGLVISVVGFILTATEKFVFNKIALSISSTMRKNAFEKVIRMPLSWFQVEEHSSGRLSVSIDSDCNTINKFTSSLLMSILMLLSGIFFGVVLAFVYQWRTALVSLGLLPLIGISGFMQLSFVAGLKSEMQKLYQSSANIINQAVKNIRTVASLAAQQLMEKRYEQKLSTSHPTIIKKSIISGVFFGLSYMMMYVIIGLIVYLGINFKINNNLNTGDVFCAIYLISFSGLNAGVSIMYFPDVSAAKTSLKRIFRLLSLHEEREFISEEKTNLVVRGKIVFDRVSFKYDGSSFNILNNVSFEIKAGQKVGVVGHSGCGKSTIVKLIQGFYRPTSGKIKIDGLDLADFTVQHLRQSIGVVNQQPVLFNDTVVNNIVYNRPGQAKDVLKLIQESSFTPLSQLSNDRDSDDWLQTEVGFKGSHLSGGQKQRIAVLRALYRKPSIFLLDEATSALDETNEKMVLSALAKSASNKTIINVTHRLGCLSNFDTILVFKNGTLIEQGRFDELIKRKEEFHDLLRQTKMSSE